MNTETIAPSRMMNHATAGEVRVRPGRASDAEVCGAICYEGFRDVAERHNFPPDMSAEMAQGLVDMLFSRTDVQSFVAERDGEILGSNFLWAWQPVSGIGPISVKPACQDASVGRRLMEAALAAAARVHTPGVRLVQSTYNLRSLSLYTKLGFQTRELLGCFQGPGIVRPSGSVRTRSASTSDLAECAALCVQVLGEERREELNEAIARRIATVAEKNGRIIAYTTGIGFFGHAVAQDNEGLQALIAAAERFDGPGFLLPMRNHELVRWCLEHGLRLVQPMTLMSRGHYVEPRGAFLPSILF
jgi:GNAT superfamily N-acetyltransferase